MTERHSPQASGLDLDTLTQALRQERRIVATFFGAVVLAAAVGTALTPRQFTAASVIQLLPRAGAEIQLGEVQKGDDAGYMEASERARTQIQIIQSRSVRQEVLKRYAAEGGHDAEPDEAGLEKLGKALSVLPREDTQLVEISVVWRDPEDAARLANLMAEVYMDANLRSRTAPARSASEWLGDQTDDYKTQLDAATQSALQFKEENDLGDVDERVTALSARLDALAAAAGEATTQRVLWDTRVSQHDRLLRAGRYDVLSGMLDDPGLQTMAKDRATVLTESADVLSRYGAQHPDYQRAQDRIQHIDATIAEQVHHAIEAERTQAQTLRGQEAQINAEIEKVKSELVAQQKLRASYDGLKADEERARNLYTSLGQRGAEVDLQAQTRLNDVRLIDEAVPPPAPSKPNVKLNLAVAAVIGLFGGVGLALLRHRLSEPVLTPRDVVRLLDQELLGAIPTIPDAVKGKDRDLYAYEHPRSPSAESYRSLRAVLQNQPLAGSCRRIVVTSCLAGEGKTTTAIGLAAAYAQLGLRVLLVDADLRLPRLHTAFELPAEPGLTDSLVAMDQPGQTVVRTPIPRLSLLRCGGKVEYPNEFLASSEVSRLLDRLALAYDVVLLDTPPAAIVADALALAKLVDGIVLVVRRGRVPRALALKTIGQLQQAGAQVLGVVVNDVPRDVDSAGYRSRYYDDSSRQKPQPAS